MSPGRLLDFLLWGFVLALLSIVALQMLTGRIKMQGLLSAKDGSGSVSPERVQLLALTLATSVMYIHQVAKSNGTALPDIDSSLLYIYGGSTSFYAATKFWRAFGSNQ